MAGIDYDNVNFEGFYLVIIVDRSTGELRWIRCRSTRDAEINAELPTLEMNLGHYERVHLLRILEGGRFIRLIPMG